MSKYNQICRSQRDQLEILLKEGVSKRKIAKLLGIHRSTLYRELKRNSSYRNKYVASKAHSKTQWRKRRFGKHRKFTFQMQSIIYDKLLNEQWSPEQIKGWCDKNQIDMISHERIYQIIYLDRNGRLLKQLRQSEKRYRKRYGSHRRRSKIPHRVGIEHRNPLVNSRSRIGDWEADTIIGKDRKTALITLIERKSRFTLFAKLERNTAENAKNKIIELLAPYKNYVHTITSDNGSEFTYHKEISKSLDSQFFFTNPYSSWEKGAVENINGLIRQYFKKGCDLKLVDDQYIKTINQRLNNRPRKSLNYETPNQVLNKYFCKSQYVALGS